jgi:hypothetical protein
VRKIIQWALVPAAVLAVAACSKSARSTNAMSDDLKRDLKLASQTQSLQINPDEVAPQSHQTLALKPKRAPQGPKVIRSEHPTVRASARAVEAASIKANVPQVQVMASAPAPSETPSADAPPMARPSPVPAASYPGAEPIPSSGGGILAGILGAVIRGGVVDDDHCDPRGHAPPRRPPEVNTGGIRIHPGTIFGGGSIHGRSLP